MARRTAPKLEQLEDRALMAVVSDAGGQISSPAQYPVPLDPGLNLVRYQWENFSIPDEFQILYQGRRIVGDVGLQSGGDTGTTVVTARNSSDQLTIKVTAPNQGTAWNFMVETLPFELNVDGRVGDVIKVDVAELLRRAGVNFADAGFDPNGFGLQATSNTKGKVAEIDNYQDMLKRGEFYFIPSLLALAGPNYGATLNHTGVGDSELTVTNGTHQFPVKFRIADGFSTGGANAVTFDDTKKLDVYRQQQRLAFLGYPNQAGSPLVVDGDLGPSTHWARKMFNVATNPAVSGRGLVPNQGTAFFRQYINNADAPSWNSLSTVASLTFPNTLRTYGMDASGDFITTALENLGDTLVSTGVSRLNGTSPPSSTHDGGRSIDIDSIPGRYYFVERVVGDRSYVAAADGGIVVLDGGVYRAGTAAEANIGVRTSTLVATTNATLVNAIANLMEYKRAAADVQAELDAFINAGSPIVFYNDPRFLGGVIRFATGHFDHIHYGIPAPIGGGVPAPLRAAGAPAGSESASGPVRLLGGRLTAATDLGRINGTSTVSGTLTAGAEQIYRFEIGDIDGVIDERVFFDTPRDLSALLSGLTADADLELIIDPNGDEHGEVLFADANAGTADEVLALSELSTGVYYLRVASAAGDTPFSLSLTVPPLPVPADAAGNAPAAAADLGVLGGVVTRTDFIGEVDPLDFYRFQLTALSDVDFALGGLTLGDPVLTLGRDANGDGVLGPDEELAVADAEGSDAETLRAKFLPAGDYLVRVSRVSGNTTYQLTATAAPSAVPADTAGNTTSTAADLGVLGGVVTRTDFIGVIDRDDIYRFTAGTATAATFALSGLSGDVDFEVYRDANGDGVLDVGERLATTFLTGVPGGELELSGLAAGNYFVRVLQFEGDTTYTLTVTPGAVTGVDLRVTRTGPATAPTLGATFTYTVTVTNQGTDAATGIVLTDLIPSGLQYIRAVPTGGGGTTLFTGAAFEGRVSTLAPGASATFDITVRAVHAGSLPIDTTVTGAEADLNPADNLIAGALTVGSIVSPPADLSLTQTASTLTPAEGTSVTFTLSVTNNGPGTATVIRVLDQLPAGLTFRSAAPTQGSYDPATGVWAVGNLPPGATVRLGITADVTRTGRLANVAEIIGADEADPDSTPNNGATGEDDYAAVVLNSDNVPPTISDVADVRVPAGQSSGQITFAVGDAGTPAPDLVVTATSTDAAILPPGAVVLGGTGADRTITITPAPGRTGTATVTLTVTDADGQTATDTFVVTVSAAAMDVRLTADSVPAGADPVVVVKNRADGTVRFTVAPFGGTFLGGLRVAVGDVTGDGTDDMVVGAADGGGPRVTVYDGVTGTVLADFMAYDPSFRGGVSVGVAGGNVVTGAGVGGAPHLKVFTAGGSEVASYYVFDPSFRGGVSVATGDVTGDGISDVVVGAGAGGGPHVKVFDGITGDELASYFVGPADDRGGVRVVVRDLAGDGTAEVVARTAAEVRAFAPLTGEDRTDEFTNDVLSGVLVD